MQDQTSWRFPRLLFAGIVTVFSFNLCVIAQGQMPEHSHPQQQNKPEQEPQQQTEHEHQMSGM